MFSYQLYNVLHFVGLAFLMVGLGGVAAAAAGVQPGAARPKRGFAMALHGTGLFLILLGGFGMLARLGIIHGGGFPGWIWAKLVIWAVLGGAAALPFRFPGTARPLLVVVPLLAGLAAYMAIYKPL
jgi:hypothetical protein